LDYHFHRQQLLTGAIIFLMVLKLIKVWQILRAWMMIIMKA